MAKIEFSVRLEGFFRKDEAAGVFVSYCEALRLYSQGTSPSEAKKALESAIFLYLCVCYDRGILGRVLHERGFSRMSADSPSVPIQKTGTEFIRVKEKFDEKFDINVPLYLVADAKAAGCQL